MAPPITLYPARTVRRFISERRNTDSMWRDTIEVISIGDIYWNLLIPADIFWSYNLNKLYKIFLKFISAYNPIIYINIRVKLKLKLNEEILITPSVHTDMHIQASQN